MDEDTDVDSRIEAAVAAERERSDKTTKDLVRLVSGILKQRLIPLEKRSYRITDEALWPA